MVSAIDTGRLLRESAPIAAVVGFWVALSWLGREPGTATGIRYAGVVMALLYTVVRGVHLADSVARTPVPDSVGNLLRENVRVAVPAGIWFLAAVLAGFVAELWDQFVRVGLFTTPADELSFVFTATGVLTVVCYAIAVGLPRVSGDRPTRRDAAGDTTPADD